MNRAITGAWGAHRNKISLNSPLATPPPPGSAAAAALAAKAENDTANDAGAGVGAGAGAGAEPAGQGEGNLESRARLTSPRPEQPLGAVASSSDSRPGQASSSPATAGVPVGVASTNAGPSTSTSTSTKRKLRPSRDGGTSSVGKRAKASSASSIAEKYTPPTTRLADLGGVAGAIEKVLELIAMPLCHPEIYAHTGVKPPRGVLLHGPPGCGKTMLAGAIAGELSVPFLSVSAPSIVSGTSGESEKTLRDTFEEAARIAPAILFIDEIDAITPKRETAQREMERRIVAQLLTCLDDLSWEKTDGKPVMIIGATNRPDSLDPALRRAGRFDHEIALGVPDEAGREQILRVLASKLRLSGDFDFGALAKATPGYVGADLSALTGAAGIIAVKRIFQHLGDTNMLPTSMELQAVVSELRPELSVPESTIAPSTNDQAAQPDIEMVWDAEGDSSAATTSLPAIAADTDGQTSRSVAVTAPSDASAGDAPAASNGNGIRPSTSFFDALPPALQISSIATFLRTHPSPLTPEQLEPLSITLADFETALPSVQPSSKREGFATVPDVTWADVGALHETRDELSMAIVQPIRRPELFRAVGVSASSGVLLWGPPGCGKTLLAKAVANESRANFISVKGPELLNKYVGESERAVRQVFARARTSSPCVIFFDELDALVPRRDDALSESSSRVVNTLLTELDGLESRVQTYVIAATNRPDMIDPAMCRPGRLDKLLYVDLPSAAERLEILRTLTKKTPLADEQTIQQGSEIVRLEAIAHDARADGFSGADLAALVREAAVTALRETLRLSMSSTDMATNEPGQGFSTQKAGSTPPSVLVTHAHFVAALDKVSPSVSVAQRKKYANLRSRLAGLPTRTARTAEGAPATTETEPANSTNGQLDPEGPAMAQ